jgi:hypothetical protein
MPSGVFLIVIVPEATLPKGMALLSCPTIATVLDRSALSYDLEP